MYIYIYVLFTIFKYIMHRLVKYRVYIYIYTHIIDSCTLIYNYHGKSNMLASWQNNTALSFRQAREPLRDDVILQRLVLVRELLDVYLSKEPSGRQCGKMCFCKL